MKDSQILERFFEQQHHRWKREMRLVLKSITKDNLSPNPENRPQEKEKNNGKTNLKGKG